MRLDIDFAERRRRRGLPVLLLGLSAVLLVGALWEWRGLVERQQAVEATLAGMRQRAKSVRLDLPSGKIEAINKAIRQLNLPWANLLAAIEGKLSERVALLALEPDAERLTLRIQAEAKSAEDMIDFAEELSKDPLFVAVTLTRHEINTGDRNRPVRFTVEAQWRLPS